MVEHMFNPDLMTSREAAAQLRTNTRRIARLVQSGRLEPYAKAPGARGAFLFTRAAVDALQEELA